MNAEHKRPLFAFLIVTVVAAVVFATGLQRQVADVIRNGTSTVVAGTSLLHDPLYVVEEGARLATQDDETATAAGDQAGQPPTPLPGITDDEPTAAPFIAPDSQGAAGDTGSTATSRNAEPGANAGPGANGLPGADAGPGGHVADGGPGRPRDNDDAAGNDGPGGGGPVTSQPEQAEGNGEPPERPEAHGHGRSDDRNTRRADHSGPGRSGADHGRGQERASGHGSGHDQGKHKAQGKGHGGGHGRSENRGKAKGHGERGHGRD